MPSAGMPSFLSASRPCAVERVVDLDGGLAAADLHRRRFAEKIGRVYSTPNSSAMTMSMYFQRG